VRETTKGREVREDFPAPIREGSGWSSQPLIGRAGRRRGVAAARGRPLDAAVGNGPLHAGADEHRGVVDALAAAGAAAADVNLVAVVLVVRHPVDVIEGRVVL